MFWIAAYNERKGYPENSSGDEKRTGFVDAKATCVNDERVERMWPYETDVDHSSHSWSDSMIIRTNWNMNDYKNANLGPKVYVSLEPLRECSGATLPIRIPLWVRAVATPWDGGE